MTGPGGDFTGGGWLTARALFGKPATTVVIKDGAKNLGVSLIVGGGPVGSVPAIASTTVLIPSLNQDLTVGAGCGITIQWNGILTLNQSKGNIVCSTGGTNASSVISNAGTVNFNSTAAITYDLPLLNSGTLKVSGGTLEFTQGSLQNCYSIYQDTGSLQLWAGATLKADAGTDIEGGQFATYLPGRAVLDGDLNVQGGTMVIGQTGYGLLSVGGTVSLSGSTTLDISINASTNQFDSISASGSVTLSPSAELEVVTGDGPATQSYDIIYSVAGITPDFSTKDYIGGNYTTAVVNDAIVGEDYQARRRWWPRR